MTEYVIIRLMKNERDKNGITELLYEHDGMLTEFDAKVVSSGKCEEGDGYYAVLDRTAFFPEGGGQDADTGELIRSDGQRIAVTDVQTVNGQVRHYVDKDIAAGESVHGCINAPVRFLRMQNHGAEHLVCGLIHSTYGYDNVGFHMTEDGMVIDINGPLSKEDLSDIEKRANRAVYENVPITVSFPTPEEAEKIPYRSKLDIENNVRLVTIEGYDVCACCAPHADSTGRFGVIKILGSIPHRGGVRITLVAGENAYRDYCMLHDDNAVIMELLSAGRDKTVSYTADLLERQSLLKEENKALRQKLTAIETEEVLSRIRAGNMDQPYEVIFSDTDDMVQLRNLVNECTKIFDGIVCAFMGKDGDYRYIFACREGNDKLKSLTQDFNQKHSGRGGGSNIMVSGSSAAVRSDIEDYFSRLT